MCETPAPTSGTSYHIRHADQVATVVQVGASVRDYRVGDRPVFHSIADDRLATGYHGAVLLPWPNRIADGLYSFAGERHQLGLTEPARHNAIHGLVAWLPWTLVDHRPDRVRLAVRVLPSPGYPFHVDATVEYRLDGDGLTVNAVATNPGARPCPYAIGFHPYLSPGSGAMLDECWFQLDARRHLQLDERLVPIGEESVDGTALDFREPVPLAGLVLDDGFSAAGHDAGGRSWARLTGPDGRTASVWADRSFDYWQVFTGETLPADLRRHGLGAEPMTAAADAFNNGRGLARLEPGQSMAVTWGATLS